MVWKNGYIHGEVCPDGLDKNNKEQPKRCEISNLRLLFSLKLKEIAKMRLLANYE